MYTELVRHMLSIFEVSRTTTQKFVINIGTAIQLLLNKDARSNCEFLQLFKSKWCRMLLKASIVLARKLKEIVVGGIKDTKSKGLRSTERIGEGPCTPLPTHLSL